MKMALQSLLFGSTPSNTFSFNLIYTLFRFYCGISLAIGAGLSKVFHKINEDGGRDWDNLAFGVPDWFVKQVSEIGFTFISPSLWAYLAVYGEFIGGLLIAFGLLTRISAIQMAFQFFVVSFIWYDEPVPFTMYYQQLIFWSFVLIAAMGGGRFSIDHWLLNHKMPDRATRKPALASALFLLAFSSFGQPQAAPARVTFTIANPSLKNREIDIRYFDNTRNAPSGYGYDLTALGTHPANMPEGTRVYEKKKGRWELKFVVTGQDNGRRFDLTSTFDITREQRLQAMSDEQNEATARLKKAAEQPGIEALARTHDLNMVTFRVAGKSWWSRQVYVRVQLPYESQKTNVGFSQKLNRFSAFQVSYPVGTKVYLCVGAYWKGDVKETYLFTVESEKAGDTVRL
jgi:uncharacterized membrane protein YphA (DoxX/SURF4 family)